MRIVIPARYASSRLPGKPLLNLAGKPLLQWVYERAKRSAADSVVIATDDQRIADLGEGLGAQVCMTSAQHRSGTERIAEVIAKLGWSTDEIIINWQGDEPLLPVELVNQLAHYLAAHPQADMASLAAPIDHEEQFHDPHTVKVVFNQARQALYFSRAPIPYPRQGRAAWRHIGLYAYRAGFIQKYCAWPSCELEQIESLEQLRTLYYGGRIQMMLIAEAPPAGVDTMEDLQRVAALMSNAAG